MEWNSCKHLGVDLQRVWEGSYLDVPAIMKQRFSKKYRHAVLDKKITQSRLKQVIHILCFHVSPCPVHAEGTPTKTRQWPHIVSYNAQPVQ